MTTKHAQLEKRAGMKIAIAQKQAGNRFGPASAQPVARREQRERDRAAGLVPFAVKLPSALVAVLCERAQRDGVPLNELTQALLQQALRDAPEG